MDISSIIKTFESNPIVPLAASGGLTIWLISNIKTIFYTVKNAIVALISFQVYNGYEDSRGIGYTTCVQQQIFNKLISDAPTIWERSKHLDLSERMDFSVVDSKEEYLKFSNTYGFSVKILFGSLVFCWRYQKTESQKVMLQTDLRVFFARKNKFMKKLDQFITTEYFKLRSESRNRPDIVVKFGGRNNMFYSRKNKRSVSSIYTNNNEHIELLRDIQEFSKKKEIYSKINYPHKFNAILEGPPGTGKSSTILAIASELNRKVHYINLSTTSASELIESLNTDTEDTIYVFEDIDALNNNNFSERAQLSKESPGSIDKKSTSILSLSLSDLLNITDGLLSSDGSVCLFTTNHIEKLDSALLRAGRMNKIVHFTYMTPETANRMLNDYLGFTLHGLKPEIKPGELQEEILNVLIGRTKEFNKEKFLL